MADVLQIGAMLETGRISGSAIPVRTIRMMVVTINSIRVNPAADFPPRLERLIANLLNFSILNLRLITLTAR